MGAGATAVYAIADTHLGLRTRGPRETYVFVVSLLVGVAMVIVLWAGAYPGYGDPVGAIAGLVVVVLLIAIPALAPMFGGIKGRDVVSIAVASVAGYSVTAAMGGPLTAAIGAALGSYLGLLWARYEQTLKRLRKAGLEPGSLHDSSRAVSGFLRWLRALQRGGHATIKMGQSERELLPASNLLLLGDILELWDGEDRDVLLSSMPNLRLIEDLGAVVTYVVGNHDASLNPDVNRILPFGRNGVEVVREKRVDLGDDAFIFIHGHQLDSPLRYRLSELNTVGKLRQAGASMGEWAHVFLPVFLSLLYVGVFTGSLVAFLASVVALLLWVPRFFVVRARAYWMRVGLMFRLLGRKATSSRRRFQLWWERLVPARSDKPNKRVSVVFGHTHLLDVMNNLQPQASELPLRARDIRWWPESVFNISSWVREEKGTWGLFFPTIFYADRHGPLILGWNPTKGEHGEPFHIPLDLIPQLMDTVSRIPRLLDWSQDGVIELQRLGLPESPRIEDLSDSVFGP